MRKLLEKKSGSNVSEATVQLLKHLNVPVTATTAIEQVESHPDFPSLYSISDSLKSWKVENAAYQVDAEHFDHLPTPFIAHTRKGGGNFVLVKNINGSIELVNDKGKEEKLSRESFLKDWTATVLLAEKGEHSGEKDYTKQKRKELMAGLHIPVLLFAGLLLTIFFTAISIGTPTGLAASLLLFAKLAGCVVTGLLLWFEVDKSNPVLQQICSGNKNTNCTAVLSSKGGKLFSWLSWSEVGFFYFSGSFLYLLLSAYSLLPTLSALSWLNLLALPYTVFSVYYQWRIAKQWCPLCLAVQALLLTEFAIAYFGYWYASTYQPINLSTYQLLPLLASFSLPVLFWIAAKKAFRSAHAGKQYNKELSKLKYNKEIFTGLLQKQKAITSSTKGLGITLGNPEAKHTIVKVCNPYCGPCAKAHKVIDELLEGGELNVQIIFMVADGEGDKAKVVKHLLAIYEKRDESMLKRALDDWYNAEKKDYAAFHSKYPFEAEELNQYGQRLDAMKQWCLETSIAFTPSVFIDGCQMPDVYRIEDLKHLL